MLIEIILFLFLGTLFGTFTGLIPGIHINMVGAALVSLSSSLFYINPVYFVVFIVSMAITHTFLDFIPSVFLGAPDTDTELSVLPGHEMLNKGYGYEAIILTAYGSLAAIFIIIAISYPSIIIIPKIYGLIKNTTPAILIIVSLFLIFSEKNKSNALFIFILSGFLGLSVLNLTSNSDKFLLPLLTGLFGSSTLILSIKSKTKIPKQKISRAKIKYKPLIASAIASPFCSFLPGLGSGQAAVIGNSLIKTDRKGFLILLGATNTLVMGFSFISLYTIAKTRTGAADAIKSLTGLFSWKIFVLIMFIMLISGIFSFLITKLLAKFFSQKIEKINYSKLSAATLIILSAIVLIITGIPGLIILIISSLTGVYCISIRARRINMMGCLLLPTILFYLFGI